MFTDAVLQYFLKIVTQHMVHTIKSIIGELIKNAFPSVGKGVNLDAFQSWHTHTHTLKSKLFMCFFPCLLHSSNFNQMVGTYEELQAYLKEYVEELSRSDERRNAL